MQEPSAKSNLVVDCLMHDLNNAFQTVTDAAGLIASDPKWALAAAMILRGVDRSRRIVSSIIEADRPVCLRELLDSAARFAEDLASVMDGPALRFSIEMERGVLLTARGAAIERALVNLFVNSAQAAAAAGAEICSISIAAVSHENILALTISDDGPGIPENILPSIFSPRFSTRRDGAGLGLHIVETVVTESGGSVTARNAQTGGAVFEIRLPAGANSRARAEAALSR